METISESLRREIKRRGLYASEVARLADVPVSTVTRFLRGERGLGGATMESLAEAFGLILVPIEEVEANLDMEAEIERALELNYDVRDILRSLLRRIRSKE